MGNRLQTAFLGRLRGGSAPLEHINENQDSAFCLFDDQHPFELRRDGKITLTRRSDRRVVKFRIRAQGANERFDVTRIEVNVNVIASEV